MAITIDTCSLPSCLIPPPSSSLFPLLCLTIICHMPGECNKTPGAATKANIAGYMNHPMFCDDISTSPCVYPVLTLCG